MDNCTNSAEILINAVLESENLSETSAGLCLVQENAWLEIAKENSNDVTGSTTSVTPARINEKTDKELSENANERTMNPLDRQEEIIYDVLKSNRAVKQLIAELKTSTLKIRQVLEDVMDSDSDNIEPMLERVRNMNKSARETAQSLMEITYMQDRMVNRIARKEIKITKTNTSEALKDETDDESLDH